MIILLVRRAVCTIRLDVRLNSKQIHFKCDVYLLRKWVSLDHGKYGILTF